MSVAITLTCPKCGLLRRWREGQTIPEGDIECPCGAAYLVPVNTEETPEPTIDNVPVETVAMPTVAVAAPDPTGILESIQTLAASAESQLAAWEEAKREASERRKDYDKTIDELLALIKQSKYPIELPLFDHPIEPSPEGETNAEEAV